MRNTRLFKKILAILIVLILLAFTSCTQDEVYDDIAEPITTSYNGETVIQTDRVQRIPPNLPDYDFEGHTFRVLTNAWDELSPDLAFMNVRDLVHSEELGGNPLNEAVFRRNQTLQDRYNFTIEQMMRTDPWGVIRTSVAAGDSQFDSAMIEITGLPRLIVEGHLIDLFTIDHIDFEKPWWDQNMVDNAVKNRLFFASGDLNTRNKDRLATILFNKQLLDDLELDCPYELVRNGQWTLEALYTMARTASADLGGQGGLLNPNTDRFGLIYNMNIEMPALIAGAGVRFIEIGVDGLPSLVFETDRNFRAVAAVRELLSSDFSLRNQMGGGHVFEEGRSLFKVTQIQQVELLRAMETDFGVLPMPWLDEHQGEWKHSADASFSNTVVIPNFHDERALDRIAFMLEAIASESRYTIIPAYYDIQLTGQLIRDEQCREMLEIIFNSIVWESGIVYGWINLHQHDFIMRLLSYPASTWEIHSRLIEDRMQRTVDDFANME